MKNNRTKAAIFSTFLLTKRRLIQLLLAEFIMFVLMIMIDNTFIVKMFPFIAGNDLIAAAMLYIAGRDLYREHSDFCKGYGISGRSRKISFITVNAVFILIISITDTIVRHAAAAIVDQYRIGRPDTTKFLQYSSHYRPMSFFTFISNIISCTQKDIPVIIVLFFTIIFFLFAFISGMLFGIAEEKHNKKAFIIPICTCAVFLLCAVMVNISSSKLYSVENMLLRTDPTCVYSSISFNNKKIDKAHKDNFNGMFTLNVMGAELTLPMKADDLPQGFVITDEKSVKQMTSTYILKYEDIEICDVIIATYKDEKIITGAMINTILPKAEINFSNGYEPLKDMEPSTMIELLGENFTNDIVFSINKNTSEYYIYTDGKKICEITRMRSDDVNAESYCASIDLFCDPMIWYSWAYDT